jgi:peptidoglycan/LPS O-acetylase OafA/YrhL
VALEGSRDNNFDAVRLLAAFAVLVGHAWPLTGTPHPPRLAGLPIFELGVDVFFALSGFLIATSWARSPKAMPFLTRRVFRIFPALFVVVVASVLVIGPLMTRLSTVAYFADAGTWAYLGNLSLAAIYPLPGVFESNPVDAVVNGSLWTLGPEFLCYLGVLAIGLVALVGRRGAGLRRLIGFAVAGGALVALQLVPGAAPAGIEDILRVMVFFAAGAVLAELHPLGLLDRVFAPWIVLAVAIAMLVAGIAIPDAARIVAWIGLPLVVIGLGSRSTPVLRRAARFGDLSYGLYLWGFPVQQSVTLLLPRLPLAVDILIVAVSALLLALGSWWLVEGRALRAGRALSRRLGDSMARARGRTPPR